MENFVFKMYFMAFFSFACILLSWSVDFEFELTYGTHVNESFTDQARNLSKN